MKLIKRYVWDWTHRHEAARILRTTVGTMVVFTVDRRLRAPLWEQVNVSRDHLVDVVAEWTHYYRK